MKEKPNYYAIITANVRYDNELKANEKLLYAEITALSNAKGVCWASNQYFAELYDVSKRSVTNWIAHLKERGYIDIENIYKKDSKEIEKRIIRIAPKEENFVGGIEKNFVGGIEENFYDNTTSINTTSNNNVEQSIDRVSEIVEYLNKKADKSFKANTQSTKKHIQARLNEGFEVDDFKAVIDKKVFDWTNSDMSKYIRPQTLFGTKFESYLNEVTKREKKKKKKKFGSVEDVFSDLS